MPIRVSQRIVELQAKFVEAQGSAGYPDPSLISTTEADLKWLKKIRDAQLSRFARLVKLEWQQANTRLQLTLLNRQRRRLDAERSNVRDEEGLHIEQLLYYLSKDTSYFSNGLATNVFQLYKELRLTDKAILSLRAGESAVEGDGQPTRKREFAEWRRDRLESASTTLIAFANQKLIEQRFRRVQQAISVAGVLLVLGAGSFAVAPQLARVQSIGITQPTAVNITILKYGDCPMDTNLGGVAVGGDWDSPIVNIKQRVAKCPIGSVTFKTGEAVITPVLPSASPAPTALSTPR